MSEMTDTDAGAPSAVDVDDDPIEDRLRRNIRATIDALLEEELEAFLGCCRYGRRSGAAVGYRHGRCERRLAGTFGTTTASVPRARVEDEVGEWRSQALSRYQRRTRSSCARSTAGKPSLDPSSPTPLTEPPEQAQLPTLGAPLENFHQKRDTTWRGVRSSSRKQVRMECAAMLLGYARVSKSDG